MENFKLVIEARTLDDYGNAPGFAEIEISQAFIDRLSMLCRVCGFNNLQFVSVCASPDKWDKQEELRISGDSLYVSSERFWYEAYPKHATAAVETWTVPLGNLVQIAQAGSDVAITEEGIYGEFFRWQDGVLFYSSLPEELADRYWPQEGGDQ